MATTYRLSNRDGSVTFEICKIWDGYRPIMIRNDHYENMDKMLTFLNRNMSALSVYKGFEKYSHSQFINDVIECLKSGKDLDEMQSHPEIGEIWARLSKDKFGTIWME